MLIKIKNRAQKENLPIRQPVVAGAFYPADKKILSDDVEKFLANAELSKLVSAPKIIIVPHAGYEYSGQVAAYGFKQIANEDIKTVVLIGPSHHDWFDGISIYEKGFWQTPLGKIEIDANLAKKLVAENKKIFFKEDAHSQEHCLEVQLPFLQKILTNFSAKGSLSANWRRSASGGKIVPIIMGGESAENPKILAEALAKYIDDKTLIVISSDLSHYPPYRIAQEVDGKTIAAILSGKIKNFEQSIREEMQKDQSNLATCACGSEAIKAALLLAEKLKLDDVELLKYANSGDVTGDLSQVVGYAAISFGKKSENQSSLTEAEQKYLLKIARDSIVSYLKNKTTSDFKAIYPNLEKPQGVFVTLRKGDELRGCIGRIGETEVPLYKLVPEMAVAAAFEDTRFLPVEAEEIKDIKIEISVLTTPRKIKDPTREIELGKHGVIVKRGIQSGVFLPQVAAETDWDLETFMGELCSQKAGLSWDCWKKTDVDIYVFEAFIF